LSNPTYIGVVAIRLLHELGLGYVWPVAVLYSARKRDLFFSAVLGSSIIGIAYLVSLTPLLSPMFCYFGNDCLIEGLLG
jgi:hypothetical protein